MTTVTSPSKPFGLRRWLGPLVLLALALYLPFLLTERAIFGVPLSNMMLLNLGLTQINLMLIAMLGALSLNYLTGCAGLISIGHAAFYATGAMAAAITGTQLGWPFPLVLLSSALLGAVVGVLAGLPSLRVRGLYFVLSTLAVHYLVVYVFLEYQLKFFDVVGVPFPVASIGAWSINTPMRWYAVLLPIVAGVYWALQNSLRTREGRAMMAMRDHELAASAMGVNVRWLRLKAFGLSSALAAFAGALFSYQLTNVNAETFNIGFAIQFIAMIIVGGMGSLPGALVGAALWLLLPSVIGGLAGQVTDATGVVKLLLIDQRAQVVQWLFAVLVMVLLIFAPGGLVSLGRRIKDRLTPKGKSA